MVGYFGEIREHLLEFTFSDPRNELLKRFSALTFAREAGRNAVHDFRCALGWDCTDGQSICAAILFPFPAEDELEMRDRVAANHAVDAVKADVRNVMLAAGVEAAADLDA